MQMHPTRTLSPAEQFFFDNAGWSYGPAKETQAEGRTRCAIEAAAAEALYMEAATVADVGISWEHDEDAAQDRDPDNGPFISCEIAYIWCRDDAGNLQPLASLGAIWDADENYRRVVRAELAAECADVLRTIIAAKE